MKQHYQVIIVGSGVTGSALTYLLAQYSSIDNIAILDKYDSIAKVNSDAKYNSQTLHSGDIETNYSLEKAQQVYKASDLVRQYASRQENAKEIIFQNSKMILGVGEAEVETIKKRHTIFAESFPYMKLMDEQDIAQIESNVTKYRNQPIAALGTESDYCAVNFGNLARSFIKNASTAKKRIDVLLNHKVFDTKRIKKGYQLSIKTPTGNKTFTADFVVFSTGAYSLTYAKSLGYGHNYGLLCVAGSFYFGKQTLNGKVYTIQNDKLPFAAVHGDPDICVEGQTRFGPTALILPQLERYRHDTYLDYFKVLGLDKHAVKALWKLAKEKDIRNYIMRNFVYEIPAIGKRLFAQEVQKIVPSIKVSELKVAKGFGGLRPQIIDKDKEELVLGEAHIGTDEGLIFNITPSPGASTCLHNALADAHRVCEYLHASFDKAGFKKSIE
ncbi:Malate:quinone oxidoreductase [uncultured Candidatus Thioglobus sp.]|nr:Malate:quinone oxidoreductase [uncultured Candidatus Thioglobus sp.]